MARGTSTKVTGALGESLACEFLASKGYTIVLRNFLRPWGEIDIVAEKQGIVHFVEVKAVTRENLPDISRENDAYRPEEQVHPAKLRKIARTAEMYMNEKNDPREYQIDVVGVFIDVVRRQARCRIYEQVL